MVFEKLEMEFGTSTRQENVKIHPLIFRKYLLELANEKIPKDEKTRVIKIIS